jgi:hypothetical protein
MKENMLVMNKKNFLGTICVAVAVASGLSACGDGTTRSVGWEFSRNMYDPIAYNPDQPNDNFENKQTAQLPPEGTVPVGFENFGHLYNHTNEDYERAGAELVNPLEINEVNLAKGEHLFQVFSICNQWIFNFQSCTLIFLYRVSVIEAFETDWV